MTQAAAMSPVQPPAPVQPKESNSERFTSMVMSKYSEAAGPGYEMTNRERQLIRNYFICIDQMLVKAEAERLRKNASNSDHEKYDNPLPYTWTNVNLPSLALDLAHFARVGLDMMEDNNLFPIPYRNTKDNRYDITLMQGYNGIRYQAEKYALDPPLCVTVEVIFSNDKFRVIKKDSRNPVEGYEFDIPEPLNRGEPVGVFGYIQYDDPSKNKLVLFSQADVMKRKPKYASAEFWGGVKSVYDKEKGKRVDVEYVGWVPEMYEKTMKREIYGSKHIPRDPGKIDASYQYIRSLEEQYKDIENQAVVDANANGEIIGLPDAPATVIDVVPVHTVAPKPVTETEPLPWDTDDEEGEPGF